MSDTYYVELFKFLGIVVTLGIAAVSAFFAAKANKQAKETHLAVNSRMDELLELTKTASKAEGVIEGAGQAKTPANEPQPVVVVNEPHEPVPTTEGEKNG